MILLSMLLNTAWTGVHALSPGEPSSGLEGLLPRLYVADALRSRF